MDDKRQEWRRKQVLMRLQGYSSWDIDRERDKYFRDDEDNVDYKEKTHEINSQTAK